MRQPAHTKRQCDRCGHAAPAPPLVQLLAALLAPFAGGVEGRLRVEGGDLSFDDGAAILLDVLLPGLSGIQVAKRLKENPATKNIPQFCVEQIAGDAEFYQKKYCALFQTKRELFSQSLSEN